MGAVLGANQVRDALCAPASQRIGPFEVANSVVPARYVSGDFVVTFEHDGLHYLVLGDLMGKGLSAAMWLTLVVDLVRRACERGGELWEIMDRLNSEMHRSLIGVPLTAMFMARLHPGDSRVSYSCGGCPAAFLLRADGTVKTLDCGGPIVGALPDSTYHSSTIELHPDETLMAVSDGVIEIHNGKDFELRPDRVVNHLKYTAGDTASAIVNSLTAQAREQTTTFNDDLSVLAIKRIS